MQIHESWQAILETEFAQPYMQSIEQHLLQEKEQGIQIYPSQDTLFAAFAKTPLHEVKVVILGQDPYHGAGQAHGLSFSVPPGQRIPPSLRNIYKEIYADVGEHSSLVPVSGDLTYLAEQGVFLLNAFLTVQAGKPASHQHIGRERFTDSVIIAISQHQEGCIFLLRGNFARKKKTLIDTQRHIVLEAPHPSPFSAHKGFFGCQHFSQTNSILSSS